VQLLGLTATTESILIVTEYVETGDLRTILIDPAYEFNWKRRLSWLEGVTLAMIYLHSKKIMHRDLKAANLLIAPDGKVKVCDFGLAREVNMEDAATLTNGQGTKEWMAPEILLGQRYDMAVDVFSFAMVMYEVIFRTLPPRRAPLLDYRFEIEKETPPQDIPQGLWDLLTDCSQQEPTARPTFIDIKQRLEIINNNTSGQPDLSFDAARRNPHSAQTKKAPIPAPALVQQDPQPAPIQAPQPAPVRSSSEEDDVPMENPGAARRKLPQPSNMVNRSGQFMKSCTLF